MIRLADEEIVFFMEEGYIIKRGVLNPDLMAQARDSLWPDAPPELERHDPKSWLGPFKETSDDPASARYGYTWKYRKRASEDWMIRLLLKDPSIWGMAEQLLGQDTLAEPERIRGIYCTLPEGDVPERPHRCHVDAHPFHLGVVGYIDDVDPNGGGFSVWAGSHKRFYYDFHSQYTHDPAENYQADLAHFNQLPRVDCYGQAGDIIFWHHRIGHAAGHNRTGRIRQAVLGDFKQKTLEARLDTPPQSDMWHDWAGIQTFMAGKGD